MKTTSAVVKIKPEKKKKKKKKQACFYAKRNVHNYGIYTCFNSCYTRAEGKQKASAH